MHIIKISTICQMRWKKKWYSRLRTVFSIRNIFWSIRQEFARELLMAYISQNSLTAILFSGSQANHFADSIERSIKQMIFEKYPEFEEDTAMNVMLSFCIQGSYHAYQKNRERRYHDGDRYDRRDDGSGSTDV